MEGELWRQLYQWTERADKQHVQPPRVVHRDVLVVRVYLWSALHERPVSWACEPASWPDHLRPAAVPSQPTMSRRLRTAGVAALLRELEREVDGCLCLLGTWRWIGIVDGKPLPVGRFSADPDADWGVGAGGRGWECGYRVVALWRHTLLPLAEVRPMNVGESVAARKLLARLEPLEHDAAGAGPCYVLGDSQFDSNPLHVLCAARGRQLVAPPKKTQARGPGHRRHEPARLHALEMLRRPFGRTLRRLRSRVEGRLGNLTSFGGGLSPLPSWVRRMHRVRLWVRSKLIINAARMRLKLERVN
jgi:hypothetical protein